MAEGERADVVLEVNGDPDAEEEEQGVTRCVCGNAGIPLFSPMVSVLSLPLATISRGLFLVWNANLRDSSAQRVWTTAMVANSSA
jgi:hypothetical protein